jgi:hypothetical protein
MCRENRDYFFTLLVGLLLSCVAGVLQAGEPDPAAYMPMYLISELELRSIETYLEQSDREKRTWLLQVHELKTQANRLQRDSETLNSQLAVQREQNRMLQRSFNEYETGSLTAISLKNGEIAGLKQEVADRTLEAAAYKGSARSRLIIIIALAGSWIVFIAFKVCRFFRVL